MRQRGPEPSAVSGDRLATGLEEKAEFRLLEFPLHLKILVANCALLLASLGVCGWIVLLHPGEATLGLFVVIAATAVGIAVPLQLVILRLALSPVAILEATAERIAGGDLAARARLSRFADPRLARLTMVLNRLLDSLGRERQRLRIVAAQAFRAQETERVRIAYELEEECAQQLAGVLFRLRAIRRLSDAEARNLQFDRLRADLTDLLNRLRQFARHLHPPALRDLGVGAAIQGYARALADTSGIRIETETVGLEEREVGETDVALYRILQEALSNAVRHSNGGSIHVRVERTGDRIVGVVEDDGEGFDVGSVRRNAPCLGLFGMEERAAYARGSLELVSARGSGTRVVVRLPVTDDRASESAVWPTILTAEAAD